MKHLAVSALAFYVIGSSIAPAETDISGCLTAPITQASGEIYYRSTADILISATTNVPCVEIKLENNAGVWIEWDCDGHSITAAPGVSAHLFSLNNNNGRVFWHNCTFNGGFGVSLALNSLSTASQNNHYNCPVTIYRTSGLSMYWDVGTNTIFNFQESDGVRLYQTVVNNKLANGITYAAGFYFLDSQNWTIETTDVIGSSTNGGVDDSFVFYCSVPRLCTGGTLIRSKGVDPYDAFFELAGMWTNYFVDSNTIVNPGFTAFGCYGPYHCSSDHGTISNNTVTTETGFGSLFHFYGDNTPGSFLTNNNFHDNTINKGSQESDSVLGISGSTFGSVSGNTLANNRFGWAVYFQNAGAGFTDGGRNRCFATNGPINCNPPGSGPSGAARSVK